MMMPMITRSPEHVAALAEMPDPERSARPHIAYALQHLPEGVEPREVRAWLSEHGVEVSRQTISKWLNRPDMAMTGEQPVLTDDMLSDLSGQTIPAPAAPVSAPPADTDTDADTTPVPVATTAATEAEPLTVSATPVVAVVDTPSIPAEMSHVPAETSDPTADTPSEAEAARRPLVVWPVWLLLLPATVAIWTGWVGLGEMAGFGPVTPLPGIADFEINSAITLPIGMEVYAAYALYVWLSGRARGRALKLARTSAITALTVGALGQVAYHVMAAAGVTVAPWWITAGVACLPVAVVGLGAGLAHTVRAEQESH